MKKYHHTVMESSTSVNDQKHRNILIVDDDLDFADSLHDIVAHYGYNASVARSADAARDALKQSQMGAALIDIRLRQSSGIELLEDLRAIQPELICIMMTAYATTDAAISALHKGAYDFLRKPFHPDELLATLKRAFERLELEREKALAERALLRYQQIVSSTSDLMGFIDRNYCYQAVNDAYLRAYNLSRHQVVGRHMRGVHGDQVFDSQLQLSIDRCLRGEEVRVQTWLELPHGRRFFEVAFFPYHTTNPGEAGVVISLHDLTETQRLSEQLSYEARHDALTGLVNRREFEVRLQRLIDNARSEDTEHACCYIDLDQFKVVNDTCGHAAGDELLCQISRLLPKEARSGDTFARLGGDEFGVLMAGCSLERAERVANNLLRALGENNFRWENKSFKVGASIGVLAITRERQSTAEAMSLADRACYAAKDAGRNRIHVFREGDVDFARSHGEMQWVSRIQSALDEDRFHLESQPILPLNETAVSGQSIELLLRMQDEDGGVVLPEVFLPAAERYNLASKIDKWVCARAFDWMCNNPQQVEQLDMVCINLSASSLSDEVLCEYLFAEMSRAGLPASKVCFEITETAAIMNLSRAMSFMERLKACGCSFALDDFGSGFSSFAYLKTLPVDFVKIDGQFVKDIAEDPVDLALVRAINEVGQLLGKRTIAEFVETSAVLDCLREVGVDLVQGYFLGKPRPLESNLFDAGDESPRTDPAGAQDPDQEH